jgi:hypothetical protein
MKIFSVGLLIAAASSSDALRAQQTPEKCSYSITSNGPTWDSSFTVIPYDVVATAWARDGAYGGSGRSKARGFSSGGAAVAVASTTFWFKVTHEPLPECVPVQFSSDATLRAEVETKIHGDSSDYALATGFQAISGNALHAGTLAVAATNAGSPVQQSTISISFGTVGFTLTIPGVSVTTDNVDQDRNTIYTWGTKQVEEEQITTHCWTKIKVVTDGPFGGTAWADVVYTRVNAKTESTCSIHQETGTYTHEATEG